MLKETWLRKPVSLKSNISMQLTAINVGPNKEKRLNTAKHLEESTKETKGKPSSDLVSLPQISIPLKKKEGSKRTFKLQDELSSLSVTESEIPFR